MKIPERTEAQDDRDFRRIWRRESERYYEDEATRADDRIKREKDHDHKDYKDQNQRQGIKGVATGDHPDGQAPAQGHDATRNSRGPGLGRLDGVPHIAREQATKGNPGPQTSHATGAETPGTGAVPPVRYRVRVLGPPEEQDMPGVYAGKCRRKPRRA